MRLTYRSLNRREIGKRVLTALEKVGMAQFYHHKPSELSGGQQQGGGSYCVSISRRTLILFKLRSFLAILAILVGTSCVVALITSSQLATEHALDQFKTLGTNFISDGYLTATRPKSN
ncbi:ABC transporter permease [Candidatus Coxiella mudrowiae]|uniref:ABC transporter permease n=1 Tax=Candidatus Coxiella mudrowiae TaxID=2054173 RepID=UPI001FD059E4|nr:ABC transporter permease [Candidatus Coxiella mudrowiae]